MGNTTIWMGNGTTARRFQQLDIVLCSASATSSNADAATPTSSRPLFTRSNSIIAVLWWADGWRAASRALRPRITSPCGWGWWLLGAAFGSYVLPRRPLVSTLRSRCTGMHGLKKCAHCSCSPVPWHECNPCH